LAFSIHLTQSSFRGYDGWRGKSGVRWRRDGNNKQRLALTPSGRGERGIVVMNKKMGDNSFHEQFLRTHKHTSINIHMYNIQLIRLERRTEIETRRMKPFELNDEQRY
jgi:hypothetical protein